MGWFNSKKVCLLLGHDFGNQYGNRPAGSGAKDGGERELYDFGEHNSYARQIKPEMYCARYKCNTPTLEQICTLPK